MRSVSLRCAEADVGNFESAMEIVSTVFAGSGGKAAKREEAKVKLLAYLDRVGSGARCSDEEILKVEELTKKLEKMNPNPASVKSRLLKGKWKLLYTTSSSINGRNKVRTNFVFILLHSLRGQMTRLVSIGVAFERDGGECRSSSTLIGFDSLQTKSRHSHCAERHPYRLCVLCAYASLRE